MLFFRWQKAKKLKETKRFLGLYRDNLKDETLSTIAHTNCKSQRTQNTKQEIWAQYCKGRQNRTKSKIFSPHRKNVGVLI